MTAALSPQDIEKRINNIFDTGERLVFWYDNDGSFEETVREINIPEVKLHVLTDDNAFATKIMLEHDDKEGKYLIYAPFPKPDVNQNHLEDTLLYSREFYADRVSMIASEIDLPDNMRDVFKKLSKFFGVGIKQTNKKERAATAKRIAAFIEKAEEVGLATQEKGIIPLIAMCVLSDAINVTTEDLIYATLSYGDIEDENILNQYTIYDLKDDFWNICALRYGFRDDDPNLTKLIRSLFATYLTRDNQGKIVKGWESYVLNEKTNIGVLLDNMMNSVIYRKAFDELSEYAADLLKLEDVIDDVPLENMLHTGIFKEIDEKILEWATERLLDENLTAKLAGKSIEEICDLRLRLHFGDTYRWQYESIKAAIGVFDALNFTPKAALFDIAESYVANDYKIDSAYRRFLYAYDQIESNDDYHDLCERIQNIYQTEFLEKAVYAWNDAYEKEHNSRIYKWQKDFYRDQVRTIKEKVAVIISDAFRYETGVELANRINLDQNCEATIKPMMGTLPSYTALGMAELLPHESIQMTEQHKVLLDGQKTDSTPDREKILQGVKTKSSAIKFDDITAKNASDLKSYTSGKEVIYIYHNKIDARGEQLTTENKVFDACQEAIDDIFALIKRLSKSGNIYRFMITADHGFIYNRKPNTESDKITNKASQTAFKDRRFIIDNSDLSADGVYSMKLGDALGNSDERYLMLAKGMSVFKASGGMNYVHGGSSPQELIIPSIFVKTKKGLVDTENAKLLLVTGISKITNLVTPLDLLQEYPVSDTIKATKYKMHFVTEHEEVISNEIIHNADSSSDDPRDRMIKVRFDIKKQNYSSDEKYYFKIVNAKTGEELLSKQVLMDLTGI